MKISLTLAIVLWLASAGSQAPAPASADDLSAAKALYASGAYEEALTRLASAGPDVADEADQYRALCLLALGRTAETERSLEVLITRRPLFKMSEADVSPRLVTLFHTVRKRVLPLAVRSLYAGAKSSFDQKDYAAATTQLKDLVQLLGDEDIDGESGAFSDLKLLGEGFLRLAEAELAAAATKAAAASVSPPSQPAAPAPVPFEQRVYSIADADVTPPVDIVRTMPPWRPVNAILATREYRGILQIVINEAGAVATATFLDSVETGYDQLLLDAVKRWQFRPAFKDGAPVKYQREIPIVLSPR